jgi:hypothetical protein
MELPAKINGPVSFYAYHLQVGSINKLILLFGDIHNFPKYTCRPCEKDCHTVIDFLKDTFKNTKVCTDFFMERRYYRRGDSQYVHNPTLLISEIEHEFLYCFNSSKKDCEKFGNVRMHYADTRLDGAFLMIRHIFREIFPEYTELKPDFEVEKCETFIKHFKENIGKFKPRFKEIFMYILGLIDESPSFSDPKTKDYVNFQRDKIQKQRNALSPEIKKEAKQMIINLYMRFVEKVFGYWDYWDRWDYINCLKDLSCTKNILIGLSTILMDVYLLLRMLRKDLNDSNIVIVYAGKFHIEQYSKILDDFPNIRNITRQHKESIYKTDFIVYDEKCVEIPEKARKEIYSISLGLPKNKCLYKESEMIEIIADQYEEHIYFKNQITVPIVNSCLNKTAEKHNLTRNEVLNIIWKYLYRVRE